jgi:hypothetical protein
VYGADEAFATGTFAGLLPVVEVDGRKIGSGTIRVAHPHAWLGKRGLTQQLPVRHASLVECFRMLVLLLLFGGFVLVQTSVAH